ncbi:hypothetical protein KR767_16875 [Luteibacter anthropi]|uniref:MutS-related protein n=1 Tax=Luteibacter anthropi TaxID=564369 RepID=UPI002032B6F0|nr:hypothetical protein [Luteibacter anthropi]URX61717.1 hypothetical protein KR767_16875 [Luteibacter anthropi]
MKPRLLWPNSDLVAHDDVRAAAPAAWADLDLDLIVEAISANDRPLKAIVTAVFAAPLSTGDVIRSRQAVLADVADHLAMAQELHDIARDAMDAKRRSTSGFYGVYASSILHGSVSVLKELLDALRQTRTVADRWITTASADRVTQWLSELRENLDDGYLNEVSTHLERLADRGELSVTARLGPMNQSIDLTLRARSGPPRRWWTRMLGYVPGKHTIRIADRDEGGARALGELRDKSINEVANALAQSVDYLLGFFDLVRRELAYYLAVAQWSHASHDAGTPLCVPLFPKGKKGITAGGLIPLSVALRPPGTAVANAFDSSPAPLAIITGPNQGGKTTFLRALGQAQWLAQIGSPVPATSYECDLFDGFFSHFKQAEDNELKHGKFDEELLRWSRLIDELGKHSLVLSNESLSSTDAREATALAAILFDSLAAAGHHVVAVTHLATLSEVVTSCHTDWQVERGLDGQRGYRFDPNPPDKSSHARDIFNQVFGEAPIRPRAERMPLASEINP